VRDPEKPKAAKRRYIERWPTREIWRHFMARAKRHGVPCMREADFTAWYARQSQQCAYCGMSAADALATFKHRLHVDREVAAIGYEEGNICLACHRCNVVKSKYLTAAQMRFVAAEFFNGRNSHDALVAALEACRDEAEADISPSTKRIQHIVYAALLLARGAP
jgi:hypothetical protein